MKRLVVSGKTYRACLDPSTTQVPSESGWPEPVVFKRRGKGIQVVYQLTESQWSEMVEHIRDIGELFASLPHDPDSQAEGRACLKDVAKATQG